MRAALLLRYISHFSFDWPSRPVYSFADMQIRYWRTRRGLTQKQVASMIGVDHSSLSYWESGRRTPRLDALRRLARALRVSVASILREEI